VKVNMLLDRLPRLRSGHDPRAAFAGTFHIDEGYAALESAYATASAGHLPDPLPSEVYCHTLTDPSILAPDLAARGVHTLTLFGLQTPARLFADDDGAVLDEAVRRHLAGLDAYLAEPLAGCLARDAQGRPCLEAVGPRDLEATLSMPGGHIFHGDLSWPWDGEDGDDRWGVSTDVANLVVCGAGARRGGGVSGIGGHNGAMAVLDRRR
jgi:phytoene dehydrogenase-like protein